MQVTHSRHYESFRCSKLQEMMQSVGGKVKDHHHHHHHHHRRHHHHDHDEQGDPVSHPLATLEGEVNRDEERLDDLQVSYKDTIAIIL